jgi:L-asparaginase II
VHRGSVVIIGPDGEPTFATGSVHVPVYPRSTNKPLQALTLLKHGFIPLDDAELAIATASHTGEPEHIELVERLLRRFGFGEDDLACPPDLPGDERTRAGVLYRGEKPAKRYMNCSGKHAAMLATCAVNGWSGTRCSRRCWPRSSRRPVSRKPISASTAAVCPSSPSR